MRDFRKKGAEITQKKKITWFVCILKTEVGKLMLGKKKTENKKKRKNKFSQE